MPGMGRSWLGRASLEGLMMLLGAVDTCAGVRGTQRMHQAEGVGAHGESWTGGAFVGAACLEIKGRGRAAVAQGAALLGTAVAQGAALSKLTW